MMKTVLADSSNSGTLVKPGKVELDEKSASQKRKIIKRILVIDDDKLTQHAIASNLKAEHYEVITADDVYSALNVIDKNKIDGVISDIMMPDISGLSLLTLLKKFFFNKIPVIIISSLDKEEIGKTAIDLGAYAFFQKPLDYKELVKGVGKMLSLQPTGNALFESNGEKKDN